MQRHHVIVFLGFILFISCEKGLFNPLPEVETLSAGITDATHVILHGNVIDEGRTAVVGRGFCWGLVQNPTVNDHFSDNGFGTGAFTQNVEVIPDTTYYIRAYAINSKGASYGDQKEVNTSAILPVLTSMEVSEITAISARCGGNILSDGGSAIISRGVCFATSPDPTISSTRTADSTGTGIYISRLAGLLPNHMYYVRAYASNSARTAYGNQVIFTSLIALPTVQTMDLVSVTSTGATCGGAIINEGGSPVTAKGLCWSTQPNATIDDSIVNSGAGPGQFTVFLTRFLPNTNYYLNAFATNPAGTAYGKEVAFKTVDEGYFIDSRDNRYYKYIGIGEQIWMAENLAYLPEVSPPAISSNSEKHYYVFEYQGTNVSEAKVTSNYRKSGVLYNWTAAMDGSASSSAIPSGVKGICPEGWHLPSDQEWITLTNFLGYFDGTRMKSQTGWDGNGNGDNSSGFNAIPGGYRDHQGESEPPYPAMYWSTTEMGSLNAYQLYLTYNQIHANRRGITKLQGISVRCIRN